jgi:RNA polymerase sigma-70 factor (ECF subfamily)
MKEQMVEQRSVQRLIEKARAGDRAAFDQLVERYQERLALGAELSIPGYLRGQVDADEVLQETLYVAFRSIDRFEWRGEGSFYRWLCGIARNVVLDQAKKAKRSHNLPLPEQVPTREASPSRAMRREERFDRLERSLARLRPEYQEVLRLARIEGLKVRDIAHRMRRSEYAVKHLMARAVRQLREYFGDTESLHLPDRALEGMESEDDR